MARPPFPWVGNKEKLVPYLQQMIPPHIKQYTEVFGGSGAMILALKPRKGRLDIYNDLNNDLFNVFCCIKEKTLALSKELKFLPVQGRIPFDFYLNILDHKADFYQNIDSEIALLQDRTYFTEEQVQALLPILEGRAKLFDVYRATAFLLVMYGSYSGTGSSFGVKTIDVDAIVNRLPEVAQRLQSIVLENQSAFDLIVKRDRPDGLIYADPPYVTTEKYYNVFFPPEKHALLRDLLRNCKGYVILSYNHCPLVWDLYQKEFFIFSLKRNNPLAQAKDSSFGELILTNFDPRPFMNTQIDLFSPSPETKWELVLLNTPDTILKTN